MGRKSRSQNVDVIESKEAALSREQILSACKAIPTRIVDVPGIGGVKMQSVSFPDYLRIKQESDGDVATNAAMIVAQVCSDLNISDAYELQSGNGIKFATLYNAVNEFLSFELKEAEIKK